MSVHQPDRRPEQEVVSRTYVVRLGVDHRPQEEVPIWTYEARNPDTTLLHHDWTWCQLCQRVWHTERWVRRYWRCPTKRCSGTMLNAFPWESEVFGARSRHAEYPLRPGNGDWYPYF